MLKKGFLFFLLSGIFVFALCGLGCAETEGDMPYREFLVKEAELPQIPPCPDMRSPSGPDDETLAQYAAWWSAKSERQSVVIPDIEQIQTFARESARRLIAGRESENFLCSPVSLWLCLHALSELTEGDSRAQILDVLGRTESPNAQLDAVFRSLYWEDDSAACVPALSVWLDGGTALTGALTDRLAAGHASVFQGPMGEERYDQALRLWLNEQTRGLLKDSVSGLRLSPDDGLAVCSTLYVKSNWSLPFSRDATAPDAFYAETGEITTDFMHSSNPGAVYRGDGFTAAVLDFSDGGGVAFLLPDEGVRADALLQTDEAFRFLFSGRAWEDGIFGRVNLSVPKLDCLTDLSLRSALEKMGITDIFDPQRARFSAELTSDSPLSVSALEQYARLILNEEGVEAAAITITTEGALLRPPEEEIDFTLNRPFLYAVMSESKLPLFLGICQSPQ